MMAEKENKGKKGTEAKAAAGTTLPGDAKTLLETAAATARQREGVIPIAQMLGEMVWLLAQSPTHKRFAIEELHWYLIPPLRLSQARLFFGTPDATKERPNPGPVPCGLALWALMSEDAEKRFVDAVTAGRPARLQPNDWNSGDRLWMIDLVAPFATQENKQIQGLLTDLLENGLFEAYAKAKDQTIRFFQQDAKTGERKIMEVKAEMRTAQPAVN
jgi:cytolysin-activating lysine-acyltransferase